ncbi:cupin domain-containing protein [Pseudoxanthomonas sp. SGD-10]|nr:cupin domain-containing protein [Pseudoxanthomonas sp. SGD-10]
MERKEFNDSFGTLSETINGLIKLGYTHDFNIKEECLVCNKANIILPPEDFQIDQVFRFEGDSDPEYQSILYAISSPKFGIKGTLVNGYGISSEEATTKLLEKLRIHHLPHHVMENKSNEATPQRPEGDRILKAPMVEIDLNKSIQQIKSETTWTNSDRNSVTLFKSDTMRIVLIGLHKDAELKPHKANGVISVQVLEGRLEFTAHQSTRLEKGQMITLLDNITHSVKAVTESFFLLTLAMSNK